LSLIFTFFNVSCFLFLFGIEFIPVTLIVIYVGAIAVLFLFVILMLNIKISERLNIVYSTIPIALLLLIFFVLETFFFLRFDFTPLLFFNENITLFFIDFLDFNISSFSD
jgi:NADH-ubiquinone oxidoreductase chain 6